MVTWEWLEGRTQPQSSERAARPGPPTGSSLMEGGGKVPSTPGQKSSLFLEGFLLPAALQPDLGAQRTGPRGPVFSNERNGPDSDRWGDGPSAQGVQIA